MSIQLAQSQNHPGNENTSGRPYWNLGEYLAVMCFSVEIKENMGSVIELFNFMEDF